MERHKTNKRKNQKNVSKTLEVIELFFDWSGLKVNRGKTYLSIFGASLACPRFVTTLRIKWTEEFKLLGINFDQCLARMGQNYVSCMDKVKKELNSWRHWYLTVFGKITVIKTLCIPKFTHIATVIPSLTITQIKDIDKEFEHFLSENNPSVVDRTTRYMGKKELGLGMTNISNFWKSIKLSWLRRSLIPSPLGLRCIVQIPNQTHLTP